jgi:hypothetical protein
MPSPCRAPATLAAAMVLILLQTGCTGTPFGDSLSRSFPAAGSPDQAATQQGAAVPAPQANGAPSGTGSQPATVAPTPANGQPPAGAAAAKAPKPPGAPGVPKTTAGPPAPVPAMAPGESQVRKGAPAARPLPYRVTIRLPEADPSAPAEAVTKALRATGVAFEVETIERITSPGATPLAAPGPSPAPSPESAAPAPTTRPAPPPR